MVTSVCLLKHDWQNKIFLTYFSFLTNSNPDKPEPKRLKPLRREEREGLLEQADRVGVNHGNTVALVHKIRI
jgi:hypothetical protein